MVSGAELAEEIVTELRQRLPLIIGNSEIQSVCIFGSYARGDFLPDNSDLDFLIVYEPGAVHNWRSKNFGEMSHGPTFPKICHTLGDILDGRTFNSHHPTSFDLVPLPFERIPRTQEQIDYPQGDSYFRLLNIFLFDLKKHMIVLAGPDPREIMCQPIPAKCMSEQWFQWSLGRREGMLQQNQRTFIPMAVFNSIHVAQIYFGHEDLHKIRLLEQYREHVPDFPMKQFGETMILDKLNQKYPEMPFVPRDPHLYIEFEKQLAGTILYPPRESAKLNQLKGPRRK